MFRFTRWSQCLRRDFLVGAAAGFAATRFTGWLLKSPPRFPKGANPSYAQCGEDVIVKLLFEDLEIERPSYLDVGAFLPIAYNNTYLFYSAGCCGVLVEPNTDLIPELRAKRPRDTILNVGIGVSDRDAADYFCLTLPEWNTFDRDEAEQAVQKTEGKVRIERVVKLPLVSINRIMEECFRGKSPDFLSIDVEGLDLPILRTLDIDRFRPKVICVELALLTDEMSPETTEFLGRWGYKARAVTNANTIYVDTRRGGTTTGTAHAGRR